MGDYASCLEPIEVAVSEELLINECLREVRAALLETAYSRSCSSNALAGGAWSATSTRAA